MYKLHFWAYLIKTAAKMENTDDFSDLWLFPAIDHKYLVILYR